LQEAIRLAPQDAESYGERGIAYGLMREHEKAIAEYNEAIRLSPEVAHYHLGRGISYGQQKEYRKAIEDFTQAVRLEPKNASAHNALAWTLATCPDDSVRNGKKAVEQAMEACRASDWKRPASLGILAAAHAECRDFQEAIRWQKKALDLGYGTELEVALAKKRLQLYEEGKPHREE
jgi:serine/threonine-protein kinase